MAQATILAAGTTSATSTDVVVAAGAVVTVGIFTAGGLSPPYNLRLDLFMDTPGRDNLVDQLHTDNRQVQISGPGAFRVTRPAYTGDAVGVFSET